jgi:hypothetical protein
MYNRCGKVSSEEPGTKLPKFSSQTALGGVHDILYLLDRVHAQVAFAHHQRVSSIRLGRY